MTKILFFHNTAMWYRIPFFKYLNSIYDVSFIFTDISLCKNVYGIELSDNISDLEGVKYKIPSNSFYGISFEMLKQLLYENYDVVVDSLESPLKTACTFTLSKIRQKPIIFWSEEWNWTRNNNLINKVRAFFLSTIASNSSAIVVPGTIHKEYFTYLGVPPEKIFIMPNVSNISFQKKDLLNKDSLKKNLNIHDNKVILYVGRLVKRKGVEYLIRAFGKLRAEYKDAILIIVGRGEQKDSLKSLSKVLDIEKTVFFMDYVDDDMLRAYYLLCNICVIPSVTDGIGDPWVFIVNEAMYFGKPIIATNSVGAAFDMIKNNENGFIVPEKDIDALYNSMKTILSNPKMEMEMGVESKRIIEEKYQYTNMVDGFKNAVEWTLHN